jgi:hypothetical protein
MSQYRIQKRTYPNGAERFYVEQLWKFQTGDVPTEQWIINPQTWSNNLNEAKWHIASLLSLSSTLEVVYEYPEPK